MCVLGCGCGVCANQARFPLIVIIAMAQSTAHSPTEPCFSQARIVTLSDCSIITAYLYRARKIESGTAENT